MLEFRRTLLLLTPIALVSAVGLPGKQETQHRDILIPDQKIVLSIGEREILNEVSFCVHQEDDAPQRHNEPALRHIVQSELFPQTTIGYRSSV